MRRRSKAPHCRLAQFDLRELLEVDDCRQEKSFLRDILREVETRLRRADVVAVHGVSPSNLVRGIEIDPIEHLETYAQRGSPEFVRFSVGTARRTRRGFLVIIDLVLTP